MTPRPSVPRHRSAPPGRRPRGGQEGEGRELAERGRHAPLQDLREGTSRGRIVVDRRTSRRPPRAFFSLLLLFFAARFAARPSHPAARDHDADPPSHFVLSRAAARGQVRVRALLLVARGARRGPRRDVAAEVGQGGAFRGGENANGRGRGRRAASLKKTKETDASAVLDTAAIRGSSFEKQREKRE